MCIEYTLMSDPLFTSQNNTIGLDFTLNISNNYVDNYVRHVDFQRLFARTIRFTGVSPIYINAFNPNLPGLFCELKFLGGGGHYGPPPPKISTMDGPINLKIGTDTE